MVKKKLCVNIYIVPIDIWLTYSITRDFKLWLLDDFVLEPSENFNSNVLKIDFVYSIDKQL